MPCRDNGLMTLAEVALCAILKVLVQRDQIGSVIADIDWKAAGITEDQLYRWWIEHKLVDRNAPRIW